MPLIPQSDPSKAIDIVLQNEQGLRHSWKVRLRSYFLKLNERTYYKTLRYHRKFQSLGKYFIAFAFACIILSLDPARTSLRFAAPLVFMFFIFSWLSSLMRQPNYLTIERATPEVVHQAVPFEYTLTIRNPHPTKTSPFFFLRDHGHITFPTLYQWYRYTTPFEKMLNAFDRWAGYPKWLYLTEHTQDVVAQELSVPPLAPGESITFSCKGICHQRGERYFIGMMCALPDPFGLMRSLWFVRCASVVTVLPQSKPFPLRLPIGSRTQQKGTSKNVQKTADAEEFRSLRPWRSGDAIKHIDWKATARAQHPISREYVPEFFLRTAIAIDTYAPHPLDQLALDEGIKRSSSLVSSFDRKENQVDLLFMEHTFFHLTMGAGHADHLSALQALASIAPNPNDYLQALEQQIFDQPADFSGVIFITPRWDASRLAFCNRLQARGLAISVLVCQPDTTQTPLPNNAHITFLEYNQWD